MDNSEKQPLTLEIVAATGSSKRAQVDRFKASRGDVLVGERLLAAGLGGYWKIRILRQVACNAFTPKFAALRAGEHGVVLRVKPGDNATCTEVVLVVPHEHESPEEVFQKLTYVAAAKEGETAVDVEIVLAKGTVTRLLDAVKKTLQWIADGALAADEQLGAIAREYGATAEACRKALYTLVQNGVLSQKNKIFAFTPASEAMLAKAYAGGALQTGTDGPERVEIAAEPSPAEIAPPVQIQAPVKVEAPPVPVPPAESSVRSALHAQLDDYDRLLSNRRRRDDLEGEKQKLLDDMMREIRQTYDPQIEALDKEIADIAARLDSDALREMADAIDRLRKNDILSTRTSRVA